MSKSADNIYVVLLRGINVGGHNRLKMAELRSSLADLKYQSVETYVQSGNIVLEAKKKSPSVITNAVARKLQHVFDMDVPVHTVNGKEWLRIAGKNPLLKKDQSNIGDLHVTFCHTKPKPAVVKQLTVPDGVEDQFLFGKQEFYVRCLNGYHKSKLTNNFFEKRLEVPCTSRNWKTVMALKKMVAEKLS